MVQYRLLFGFGQEKGKSCGFVAQITLSLIFAGLLRLKQLVQYLQEEEFLCDLLDQLLRNILWKELCSELELQRILLLHVLLSHL